MKVRRIVAATDFSRTADAAVRRAALLAQAGEATLGIVHSVYTPPLAETWRKLVEQEGITEAAVRARATDDAALTRQRCRGCLPRWQTWAVFRQARCCNRRLAGSWTGAGTAR